jgi:hypothetical protein
MKNQFIRFIVSNVSDDLNTNFEPQVVAECYEALQGFDIKSLANLTALIEAVNTGEEVCDAV